MNDDGNTMKYLPLRSLEKEETKKTPIPEEETKKESVPEEKATGEGGTKQ